MSSLLPNSKPEELFVGKTLSSRYRLGEIIGSGGTGTVYLARDLSFDRQVAIKVIHSAWLSDSRHAKRLSKEGVVLACLSHPNIVKVLCTNVEAGCNYIVLEYVAGETLKAKIEREGALDVQSVKSLGLQVLDALSHAHSQGVIHRDLKPQNLIITPSGQVKVLDFGLAKLLGFEEQRITQTGEIVGTPHFISPEQCGAGEITERTDLYSLGCTMYYLLTGKAPFEGDTAMEVLYKHLEETADFNPISDVSTASVLKKAMAKNPVDRFVSANEMAQFLRSGELAETIPPSSVAGLHKAPQQKKGRTEQIKIAIALLAVAFASVIFTAVARWCPQKHAASDVSQSPSWTTSIEGIRDKHNLTQADANLLEKLSADAYKSGDLKEKVHYEEIAVWVYQNLGQDAPTLAHNTQLLKFQDKEAYYDHTMRTQMVLLLALPERKYEAAAVGEEQLRSHKLNHRDLQARHCQYELVDAYTKLGMVDKLKKLQEDLISGDPETEDADLLNAAERSVIGINADGACTAEFFLNCPHSRTYPGLRAQALKIIGMKHVRTHRPDLAKKLFQQAIDEARKSLDTSTISHSQRDKCKFEIQSAQENLHELEKTDKS